jgi:hypothetical protein
MRLYNREWRVGLLLTFSTLVGALLANSPGFRIVFVKLAIAAGVLTVLAFREDRRVQKRSER